MTIDTQNLNEHPNGKTVGTIWSHGRAWLRNKKYHELGHAEWLFFHRVRWDFGATIGFGCGESDNFIRLHLALPWLLSIYLLIPGFRCKSCQTGFAVHNGAFWLYTLPFEMESNSSDPWWRKSYSWYFPWTYDWHSTELLAYDLPWFDGYVYRDTYPTRKQKDVFDRMREEEAVKESISETHDYTYTLKSGEVQRRKAKVYVDRMTWRARWWPIIPRKMVRTCINVTFDAEVGEGTGSWKGGCTGCGYEMKHGETPLQTLRRMESERKFSR